MMHIQKEDRNILIILTKDLVASMVSDFSDELRSLFDEKPQTITIDLSNVRIVDSLGMGVLISTHNHLTKSGGNLSVINAPPDIYEAFCVMRLNHHFSISPAEPPSDS